MSQPFVDSESADPSLPKGYVDWGHFTYINICWPIFFLLFTFPLLVVANVLFKALLAWNARLKLFHQTVVLGRDGPDIRKPFLLLFFNYVDLLVSVVLLVIWVIRCYERRVYPGDRNLEIICCAFVFVSWMVRMFQVQFNPIKLLRYRSLLSVFIFTPVFMPCVPVVPEFTEDYSAAHWLFSWNKLECLDEPPYLSLGYLRAFQLQILAEECWQILRSPEKSYYFMATVLIVIRASTYLFIMSATIYVLEVLGPLPFLQDDFLMRPVEDGLDISLFAMIYFIVCTISTVGYGDYSPKTLLSRLLTMSFIVAGVIYFSKEIMTIVEVRNHGRNGYGWYHPKSKKHVVIVGTGVNRSSTMLAEFLRQLLHPYRGEHRPDVVLMTENPLSGLLLLKEQIRRMPRSSRTRITLLQGSCFHVKDLYRIRLQFSSMCYVISDPVAETDYGDQDTTNLYRVMAMRKFCRQMNERPLRMRIMLLNPESRIRAMNVGITPSRCFSANEIKADMIAHSARFPGLIPFICTLFTSSPTSEAAALFSYKMPLEYFYNLRNRNMALCLHKRFENWTWPELCLDALKKGITPIAMQQNGVVMVNPMNAILKEHDILFVLSESESRLVYMSDCSVNWQTLFLTRKEKAWNDRLVFLRRSLPDPGHGLDDVHEIPKLVEIEKDSIVHTELEPRRILRPTRLGESMSPLGMDKVTQFDTLCHPGERESTFLPSSMGREAKKSNFRSAADFKTLDGGSISSQNASNKLAAHVFNSESRCISVILYGTPVWTQVVTLLRTLKASHLPLRFQNQSVCILSEFAPPPRVIELFSDQNVAFVIGSTERTDNLRLVGVAQASAVLTLLSVKEMVAGKSPSIADHESIIGACILQRFLENSDNDAPVIFEFADGLNSTMFCSQSTPENMMKFTEHSPRFSGATTLPQNKLNISTIEGEKFSDIYCEQFSEGGKNKFDIDAHAPRISTMRRKLKGGVISFITNLWHTFLAPDITQSENIQLQFDSRFCSGQVFSSELFGFFLAAMYYIPATNELLEAFSAPARSNQRSFLWQIKIPKEFVGKTFGEFSNYILTEEKRPALPVGLHRRNRQGALKEYVLANPKADTVLSECDFLIMLGDCDFGVWAEEEGLLSDVAPSESSNARPSGGRDSSTSDSRHTTVIEERKSSGTDGSRDTYAAKTITFGGKERRETDFPMDAGDEHFDDPTSTSKEISRLESKVDELTSELSETKSLMKGILDLLKPGVEQKGVNLTFGPRLNPEMMVTRPSLNAEAVLSLSEENN